MTPANEEVTLINTKRHLPRNNKAKLLKALVEGSTSKINKGGWEETKRVSGDCRYFHYITVVRKSRRNRH